MILRNMVLAGLLVTIPAMATTTEDTQPGDSGDTTLPVATGAEDQSTVNDAQVDSAASQDAAAAEVKDEKRTNAEIVMDMQNAGYKIVNESGTQLFCKTDEVLGSRLRKKTRCLTLAEAEREQQAASDAISEISRKTLNQRDSGN